MAALRLAAAAVDRARETRARARSLCERSVLIRQEANLLSERAVEILMRSTELRVVDGSGVFCLRLGRLPAAIRLVRTGLRRWLDRGGVAPEESFRIALACSEACANAVEHPVAPTRQAFEVEAKQERDELHVAVRDFGSWDDRRRTNVMRGRGLRMIRSLMDGVEIVSSQRGTDVVIHRSVGAGQASGPDELDNVRFLDDYRVPFVETDYFDDW